MFQEISIIVYYLRTTQFSICHLFLSLSLPSLYFFTSSNPFYATTLSAIFIHPFNERRSKFQASHPRILVWSRESIGSHQEAPSDPTFSTSFDFSNRNRMSKLRKEERSREERFEDWNTWIPTSRFDLHLRSPRGTLNIRLIGCWSREFQRDFFSPKRTRKDGVWRGTRLRKLESFLKFYKVFPDLGLGVSLYCIFWKFENVARVSSR